MILNVYNKMCYVHQTLLVNKLLVSIFKLYKNKTINKQTKPHHETTPCYAFPSPNPNTVKQILKSVKIDHEECYGKIVMHDSVHGDRALMTCVWFV